MPVSACCWRRCSRKNKEFILRVYINLACSPGFLVNRCYSNQVGIIINILLWSLWPRNYPYYNVIHVMLWSTGLHVLCGIQYECLILTPCWHMLVKSNIPSPNFWHPYHCVYPYLFIMGLGNVLDVIRSKLHKWLHFQLGHLL